MKVEIISIGDELLIGQTVNTNATYLAKNLTHLGLDVRWISTVGDEAEDLQGVLSTAMQRADVAITTGGLGPTHDDITKKVAADFFESDFVFKPEILKRLQRAFEKRGIKMAKVNEEQAQVPEKADIINNPVGTAPGLVFKKDSKKCIILPGVPAEMKAICEESVFPMLKGGQQRILQKTVRTTGIAESSLYEQVGDIEQFAEIARVAFLPKASGVDIRLTVKGKSEEECQGKIRKGLEILQERIGRYVYGYDDEELEESVAKLLFKSGKTVAVAESCTGGMLANKLTNISGSSKYFERGVVAYSNQAKMDILKVPEATLEKFGAVSSETAIAMAEGIKKISGADFGISTTGIAGPTGGSEEKPIGLVYIGLATASGSYSKRLVFSKDRMLNKERSVQAALDLLKRELSKLAENNI